jgi:tetratricopeptide (TPR) repeat protein
MANRLDTLKSMLAEDPKNTFARYGLAIEYTNIGENDKAVDEFRKLIDVNPNYAAAYYHGGRALENLGKVEEAREMYEKGIEVTTRIGDNHTKSELQAALDILG